MSAAQDQLSGEQRYDETNPAASQIDTARYRERSGCLTFWLGANAVLAVIALVVIVGVARESQSFLNPLVFWGTILMPAFIVSLVGIWNWKRWGVYGLAAVIILSSGVQQIVNYKPFENLAAMIVQLAILYVLVRGQWTAFE
jgi:hypothetical protein